MRRVRPRAYRAERRCRCRPISDHRRRCGLFAACTGCLPIEESVMPVYEYMCEGCGPFTVTRPMAEYEKPHACPDCDEMSPRVMLTAPRFSTLSAGLRLAHATNERSAHKPN